MSRLGDKPAKRYLGPYYFHEKEETRRGGLLLSSAGEKKKVTVLGYGYSNQRVTIAMVKRMATVTNV